MRSLGTVVRMEQRMNADIILTHAEARELAGDLLGTAMGLPESPVEGFAPIPYWENDRIYIPVFRGLTHRVMTPAAARELAGYLLALAPRHSFN